MESLIMNELDYSKKNVSHGSYQLTRITQQTGGSVSSATTSGGSESLFDIPANKAINLSKSGIAFYSDFADPGATTHYNFIYNDGVSYVRQLQYYTRSNVFMVDIPNFHKYTNTIFRRECKLVDMLCRDKVTVCTTAITDSLAYLYGMTEFNQATNAAAVDRPDNDVSKTSYLEPEYFLVGTDSEISGVCNYINFGLLYNTMLSLDKDIMFNEITTIKIIWNASPLIAWIGTSSSNPTTGATALATTVNITGLELILAVEQNPVIIEGLRSKINNSGLSITIPYVHSQKMNLTGTNQTVSVKYNRANGSRLKKVYFVPYHATESANTAYTHNNIAGAMLTNYVLYQNSVRINQFNYNPLKMDDYKEQKQMLKGSCILSSDEFYYNFSYCLNYSVNFSPMDYSTFPSSDTWLDGYPMDDELKLDMECTTAGNALNWYIFACFEKTLTINNSGISLA